MDCRIEISGPGGCINNQLVVIEKALRDIGYKVDVVNNCPTNRTAAEDLAFITSLANKGTVVITMHHMPWGS